jgi:hypothetical protein
MMCFPKNFITVFLITFGSFLLCQWASYLVLLAEETGGINYDWQLAGLPGIRVQFLEHLSLYLHSL